MKDCCDIEAYDKKIRNVLWITLLINLAVFFIQFSAAIIADSTSLLADSIDMIGDVIAYSISLYALNRGEIWNAKAALCKGIIIGIFAFIVFIDAFMKIFMTEAMPSSNMMLIFS